MSKGTILITGLNGYLAGRVAEAVLQAGYNVRGTVRSIVAGEKVRDALAGAGHKGKVEVVQVADMTAPGAFDGAVVGMYQPTAR